MRYTNNEPIPWTESEIAFLRASRGLLSNADIAEALNRDPLSVSIKIKRLQKKDGLYNTPHREDKYATNDIFISLLKPRSVLDAFSGKDSYYLQYSETCLVYRNDKNPSFAGLESNDTAYACISKLVLKNHKFDVVDLDPFGSAYDCFDGAIRLAQKGLVITFGELGHKRFKRFDFVRPRYGIHDLEAFTVDNMILEVIRMGAIHKKTLTPYIVKTWRNIARVYFLVTEHKVTEQWNQKHT